MSEPFLAEVKIVGFNFAPRGWAFCEGQILPINQNQALFSLLGTTYGGDGRVNFALPDLRDRTPIHDNSARSIGQSLGAQWHTLSEDELPSKQALTKAKTRKNKVEPGNPVGLVGSNQEHNNMMPFLAVKFCIALQGLFPSRS